MKFAAVPFLISAVFAFASGTVAYAEGQTYSATELSSEERAPADESASASESQTIVVESKATYRDPADRHGGRAHGRATY